MNSSDSNTSEDSDYLSDEVLGEALRTFPGFLEDRFLGELSSSSEELSMDEEEENPPQIAISPVQLRDPNTNEDASVARPDLEPLFQATFPQGFAPDGVYVHTALFESGGYRKALTFLPRPDQLAFIPDFASVQNYFTTDYVTEREVITAAGEIVFIEDLPEDTLILDCGFFKVVNAQGNEEIKFYHLSYDGNKVYGYDQNGLRFEIALTNLYLVIFEGPEQLNNTWQTTSGLVTLDQIFVDFSPPSPVVAHMLRTYLTHQETLEAEIHKVWRRWNTAESSGNVDLPVPIGKITLTVEGRRRYLYPPNFVAFLAPEGFLFEEAFALELARGLDINPPDGRLKALKTSSFDAWLSWLLEPKLPDTEEMREAFGDDEEHLVEQLQILAYLSAYLGIEFYTSYFKMMLLEQHRQGF